MKWLLASIHRWYQNRLLLDTFRVVRLVQKRGMDASWTIAMIHKKCPFLESSLDSMVRYLYIDREMTEKEFRAKIKEEMKAFDL